MIGQLRPNRNFIDVLMEISMGNNIIKNNYDGSCAILTSLYNSNNNIVSLLKLSET